MALADTARLIASLELQDKFSANANKFDKQVSGLDKRMGALGTSGQKLGAGLGRAFSTIAKIGVGAAVAGVGVLAVNIKAGVDSLVELESVTTATATVLKSTDAIAGQTAEGVRKLAEEYEDLNATVDDKVIQSGANLLLTFTNIREKAFEPALEAALNMNEAMGGGPEGLQNTIIQVGKALNDPIKGVGALRRVGVQLSKGQEEQIKKLVEQNDLYGAQQIILDELATQFGGRFAAAGKTAEGRMAALGDKIEDLQKRLAGPLIPVIDRVREKLIDFLGSKTALNAAEDLGEAIAGIFTNKNIKRGFGFLEDAIATITDLAKGGGGKGGGLEKIAGSIGTIAAEVGGLPWQSIADAAKLLGTGSKALLDAFLGLPPWVQTAVLTGWGLNKLTGGALGSIVGELGKGLIKGVLNMNAAVVNVNAKTVTGGPGGVPTTGGRPGRNPLGTAAKLILPIAALELGANLAGGKGPIETFLSEGKVNKVANKGTEDALERLEKDIKGVDAEIATANKSITGVTSGAKNAIVTKLENERAELIRHRTYLQNLQSSQSKATGELTKIHAASSGQTSHLSAIRGIEAGQAGTLAQIRDKRSSVNVTVNSTTSVTLSASQVALRVQQLNQTISGQTRNESVF